MDFTGKVSIVTGGGNGIGRAVCLGLARGGSKVVVVDRDSEGGEAVAAEIRAHGGDAYFHGADVSQSADVHAYVHTALAKYGRIDCFHNNAGIEGKVAPIAEHDDAAFDAVMAINVRGVFLGMKHVMPVMAKQGGGSIVNTASTAGFIPSGGMVAYVGSKHAVIGMTKVAALEGGPQGTRVNAVCPGPIATRMTRDIARQVSPNNPDAVEARYSTTLPIGRYGTAEEVAEVVLFLLSTQSRYVTGTHYVVDGGRMIASSGISAPVVE